MISLLYGGITHHYLGSNLNYCNLINKQGSIHNEYVIAMAGTKEFKMGILTGKDSACGNIIGPVSSTYLDENFEFILGGYNTNDQAFLKRNIQPPKFMGFTPVVGLDYNFSLYKSENVEVEVHNLVSIGIITHAIGINF